MPIEFVVNTKRPKKERIILALKITGGILGGIIFLLLLLNSFLTIVVKDYYPYVFGYRAYSIVSDSMEPEIKTGTLILNRKRPDKGVIKESDIITYKLPTTTGTIIITHRVVSVIYNDEGYEGYFTKGDNVAAVDNYTVPYENVLSIYSGKKIGGMGYIVSFFSSYYGFICLLLIFMVVAIMFMLNALFEKFDKTVVLKKEILLKADMLVTEMRQNYGDNPETLALDYALSLLRAEPEPKAKRDYERRLEEFASSEQLLLPPPSQPVLNIKESDIYKIDADQKTMEKLFETKPKGKVKSTENAGNQRQNTRPGGTGQRQNTRPGGNQNPNTRAGGNPGTDTNTGPGANPKSAPNPNQKTNQAPKSKP